MSDINSAELRLSASRAFIGLIRPVYRRIGVKLVRGEVRLSVILEDDDEDTIVDIAEDISSAATEIVADFPDRHVRQDLVFSKDPLPAAHIIEDGLIYQRWEATS
jgi:hypothetical protein